MAEEQGTRFPFWQVVGSPGDWMLEKVSGDGLRPVLVRRSANRADLVGYARRKGFRPLYEVMT